MRLPCRTATEDPSHEGALGLGGGVASTCGAEAGKANRFQPLVFILERFGEKNLLQAMKPASVLHCEYRHIFVVSSDKGVQPSMFSEGRG